MTNARHLAKSTEWYTPELVLAPARALLGSIELDPASNEVANRTVKADRFFTRENDALSLEWRARTVWLNPPGSKMGNASQQALFWRKLALHWRAGDVGAAIFLSFSVELLQTSQQVACSLLPHDFPMCFPRSRVPYVKASEDILTRQAELFGAAEDAQLGKSDAPPHSSCVIYLPPRSDLERGLLTPGAAEAFRKLFYPLGRCIWTREAW